MYPGGVFGRYSTLCRYPCEFDPTTTIMKSKKPGIGSWISFEDGLLEYKESELRKEWWYYVTKDNPYVTRNERRRNKKTDPVQQSQFKRLLPQMNADFTCELAKKEAVDVYCLYMDKQTRSFIRTVKESSKGDIEEYDRNAREDAERKYDEISKYTKRNEPKICEEQMHKLHDELNGKYNAYQEYLRRMMTKKSIDTMKGAIRVVENIDQAMEEIITVMSYIQTGVRGTKWTTVGTGLGSLILLAIPPTAPFAMIGLLGTGIMGGITAIADYKTSNIAQDKINGYALQAKESLETTKMVLENLMKLDRMMKTLPFTAGAGLLSIVDDIAIAAGKNLGSLGPLLGNVLGGIGVAFSVMDAIHSQVKENTSIECARNLQGQIKASIKDLNKQIALLESTL